MKTNKDLDAMQQNAIIKANEYRARKNKAKYAPGPWKTYKGKVGTIRIESEPIGRDALDIFDGKPFKKERVVVAITSHHNADIIAAAPDLLEAAKEALAHFEKYIPDIVLDCKDSLRLAIAKAEGK